MGLHKNLRLLWLLGLVRTHPKALTINRAAWLAMRYGTHFCSLSALLIFKTCICSFYHQDVAYVQGLVEPLMKRPDIDDRGNPPWINTIFWPMTAVATYAVIGEQPQRILVLQRGSSAGSGKIAMTDFPADLKSAPLSGESMIVCLDETPMEMVSSIFQNWPFGSLINA